MPSSGPKLFFPLKNALTDGVGGNQAQAMHFDAFIFSSWYFDGPLRQVWIHCQSYLKLIELNH